MMYYAKGIATQIQEHKFFILLRGIGKKPQSQETYNF